MKCNYCGREVDKTPCLDCFPLYKCKRCGYYTSTIRLPHKKPDGSWCENTVRGFGDTRADDFWQVITEDNFMEEKVLVK